MKNLFNSLIIIALFIAVQSCKKSPTDDVPFTVALNLYTSPVLVEIKNADTINGTDIKSLSDVPVTIGGKDASLVVNGDGGTSFKLTKGFIQLALLSAAKPTTNNPISFTIAADVPNFAPIKYAITLTDTTPRSYSLTAVEIGSVTSPKPLPKGTGAALTTVGANELNNGTLIANKIIQIANPIDPELASSISLPSNTEFKDEHGVKINTSSIKASIVHYGSGASTAIGAFPGGLQPGKIIDEAGNEVIGGNFVTGGLLQINMTADNGVAIRQFSKPLDVSMRLSSTLTNFAKGGADMSEEDTIPLWSMDDNTGIWKYEGKADVVKENGVLTAKFKISHLSSWNLDWMWYPGWYGLPNRLTCWNQLKVKITTSDPNFNGYHDVTITDEKGNYLGAAHGEFIYNNKEVIFPYLPMINKFRIQVSKWMGGAILGEAIVQSSPCSAGTVNVNVKVPPPPENINVKFDLAGKCTNKNLKAYFSTWLILYNTNTRQYTWYYLDGVKQSLLVKNLQLGVTYQLGAYYDKAWNFREFTLEKKGSTKFGSPVGSLDTYNISSVYDETSNTLLVNGVINIKCR